MVSTFIRPWSDSEAFLKGSGDTTTQYFWAQTQGYCGAFVSGTPAVGTPLMRSDTTAGLFEARGGADEEDAIANMVTVGITGEIQAVNLKIRGL